MQGQFNIWKTMIIIYHIIKVKGEKIMLTDADKVFDNIQHLLMNF